MSSSTSAAPPNFNYAKAFGIRSVAAAIVFAIAYVPLAAWFISRFIARRNRVYATLTLFCLIRVTAFSIRAALAGITSAGENFNLFIADEILVGVGYFGLLYSSYTLVLDIDLVSRNPAPTNPVLLLIRNRRLFRLALVAGVVLGITALSINNGQMSNTTSTMHTVSVVIFLVLTVLQAFQTAILVSNHYGGAESPYQKSSNQSFGRRHSVLILLLIALFLLVREIFSMVTVSDSRKQNTEHFWYPLLAIPELVAVILYSAPGLVPTREELNERQQIRPEEQVPLENYRVNNNFR
ncbi:hypothetical protein D9613_003543 [Agrocybe pediades]|uniref:DUF7702 domain-containing protein n=1 Tax=Agrocybe pediades TaxID=84607 RepID=A0A8H4VMJ5_9AGAR|nr:hypothetical protein D9613_003543 [Agrocybe pediades]